jgi:hypothetical protein
MFLADNLIGSGKIQGCKDTDVNVEDRHMLLGIIGASFGVALLVYLVLLKINIRRVCGYLGWVEVGVPVVLLMPFMGTYHGMMVAMFTGLWLSGMLRLTKYLNGYERYSWEEECWHFYPR